jgi:hypothetical protein
VWALQLVASARGVSLADTLSTGAGSSAVVWFLTKFEETDRYFNLNHLAQGDSLSTDDLIARRVTLVRADAPPRRRSPAREQQDERTLLTAGYSDKEVPLAILDFTSLSRAALNSYEAMTAQTQLDEWVAVEEIIRAIRVIRAIRFLSRTISLLVQARGFRLGGC